MKRVLLMTVAGILVASNAMAGMEDARFALHAKPSFTSSKTIPGLCDDPATTTIEANYGPNFSNTPCTQYTTQFASNIYSEVYVVVGRAGTEGIAGVSFGIDYTFNGIDPQFIQFVECSNGLTVPNSAPGRGDFPDDGGGVRITWLLPDGCQRQEVGGFGVHAVVGALHIYGYEGMVMSITPNNNLQSGAELDITNCGGVTTKLRDYWGDTILPLVMGRVGFGAATGFNSCLSIPVQPTTWGKIKAQYTD